MSRNLSASMSSTISSKFIDGRAREFFWGIGLTKDKAEQTWSFEEEDEDKDYLEHTLFLRHATLGKDAVPDERNLVEVVTKTFSGEEIKQPLFSLTLGKNDMDNVIFNENPAGRWLFHMTPGVPFQCQLDINFGSEVPVTFKLVEGTGPVHLSAQQLVEFPPEENLDETEMTEYTATEEELDEDEDDEVVTSPTAVSKLKGTKRKVSLEKGAAKKKKGKVTAEPSSEEEDEDQDEEADEEDEDESMDEDNDDESEDDEEPTPEKPKKSKAKPKVTSKGKDKKPAAAKATAKKMKKKSK